MDPDLKLLRSFIMVAAEEHVGRAATRLYISQPALSKQIRRLEEFFGVALVRRVGRRIELTAAGRVLALEATQLLDQADAAMGRVRAAVRSELDAVVVGFVPPMPQALTTDLLREAKDSLGADVTLRHVGWEDQVAVVTSGRADLSLVRGPVEGFASREEIESALVFSEPRLAAFAASHPLASATSVSLDQLADEPIVATAPNTDFWTVNPRPDGRAPNLGPRVSSLAEMLEVVAAGKAMVLTAASQSVYYARPDISYVPVEGVPPSDVYVVWSADNLTGAAARVLADLRRRAGSLRELGQD
jgi:DNA-binding transcriptional LysR family regulator